MAETDGGGLTDVSVHYSPSLSASASAPCNEQELSDLLCSAGHGTFFLSQASFLLVHQENKGLFSQVKDFLVLLINEQN